MKNLKFAFLGVFAFAATLSFSGCFGNSCKDVGCVNGECVKGDCVCEASYEGLDCNTAVNVKFIGAYSHVATCSNTGGVGPYSVMVGPIGSSLTQITFVGLWQVPSNIVTGEVGNDGVSFTIERQTILPNYQIEATGGTATYDGETINLTYKIYANGASTVTDQCTAILSR